MKELILSARAREDLRSIGLYIASERPHSASEVIAHIVKRMQTVSMYPQIGEAVDRLHPGMRRYSAGTYVIYFRPTSKSVRILRILHGAQDAESQFLS